MTNANAKRRATFIGHLLAIKLNYHHIFHDFHYACNVNSTEQAANMHRTECNARKLEFLIKRPTMPNRKNVKWKEIKSRKARKREGKKK